jgi:hypothetical protein
MPGDAPVVMALIEKHDMTEIRTCGLSRWHGSRVLTLPPCSGTMCMHRLFQKCSRKT